MLTGDGLAKLPEGGTPNNGATAPTCAIEPVAKREKLTNPGPYSVDNPCEPQSPRGCSAVSHQKHSASDCETTDPPGAGGSYGSGSTKTQQLSGPLPMPSTPPSGGPGRRRVLVSLLMWA